MLLINQIISDTIKLTTLQDRQDGLPIPSLPVTEMWVSIVLVILAGLLLLVYATDRNIIAKSISVSYKIKDRDSIFEKTTIRNIYGQIIFPIYQIGIISLLTYILLFKQSTFSFITYVYIYLLISLYFFAKYQLLKLLEYIFFHKTNLVKKWVDIYFSTLGGITILLYPLLIFYLFLPTNLTIIATILLLTSSIIGTITLVIKLFLLFFQKPLALFYILLYLCILEILPVLGIVLALNNMI